METKHQIISALVENSAGVLSQVSRMFSRRGYNIDSLTVGTTENPSISRVTIILNVSDAMVTQIASQLNKLQPVISVKVLAEESAVQRELVLVKVNTRGHEQRDEVIQVASIFRAKIVDVGVETLTVEITGARSKADALLKLLEPFGILELGRTGLVALERGGATINDL